jgi:hypothetical protein
MLSEPAVPDSVEPTLTRTRADDMGINEDKPLAFDRLASK